MDSNGIPTNFQQSKTNELSSTYLQPMTSTAPGEVQDLQIQSMRDEQKNHFSLWSTIGINYSLIGTPLAIGTYLAFNIGVGGGPVYIFGYIVAVIFQFAVCCSLAEIAACFPHSSGQVFWTSVVAPKGWLRGLSYWAGAFTAAGWFFWTAGTFLLSSQLMLALVSICRETFVEREYHIYLGYLLGAVVALGLNIPLFRFYPILLRCAVIWINAGAIVVLVSLLVRATPKQSAQTVFVDFVNATGWSSNGLVFFLGLLPGITALNGFDASAHMADEMPRPGRQVPQVMIGTALLAGLSGLPMTIVFMFCVVNEANLLAPIGGQPIAQLFLDAINLLPLTIFIMLIYTILFYFASGVMITTVSRVFWSLSREGMLPASKWMTKTSGAHHLPKNAIYLTTLLATLIGLLCFGPATALNAILGSGAVCFFISYTIPLACLLWDRQKISESHHYFNLGRYGYIINWIAVLWMSMMTVFLCFPQYVPITAIYMNYTIVVLAAVVLMFTINWFLQAKTNYRPSTAALID